MIVVLICWGFAAAVALFGIVRKVIRCQAARRAAEEEQARKREQERQRAEALKRAQEKQAAARAEKERAAQARKQEQERKQAEKAAARAEREREQERKRAERLEAARQLAEYRERALQAERELHALQQGKRRETVSTHDEKPAAVTLEQFAQDHPAQMPQTFAGETVAFTGSLIAPRTTRAEAIALVRERGGDAYKDMTAKTTLLVVGKNPGAGKLDKADEWITQVKKITEAQFWQRVHAAA